MLITLFKKMKFVLAMYYIQRTLPPVNRSMNKNSLVCFRVDTATREKLDKASQRTGASVSDLIRLCLQAELKNLSKRYGN